MLHILITLVLCFLGGAICTFMALSILVPMIVGILGEHRFAETDSIDPCSYILSGGLVSAVLFSTMNRPGAGGIGYSAFPLVALTWVAIAVAGLWVRGVVGRKQEFVIREKQIVRRSDKMALSPLWAETDTDYTQTDAYHGYSFYGLTLCDASGRLARNVYLSEEKRRADLRTILETDAPTACRALDLVLLRRETPLRWLKVWLDPEWAGLLCGPLTDLSPEGRAWWDQWLRPTFPEDGHSMIEREELSTRLEELFACYTLQLDQQDQAHLRTLLRISNGPIELMTSRRYETIQREAAPEGGEIRSDPDEIIRIILKPRGSAPAPEESLLRPAQSAGESKPEELLRPGPEE